MPRRASKAERAHAGEFGGFSDESFRFLRGLRRNNKREWFLANRDRYEAAVKRPMAALVEEMDARFATIAPEICGDPRRSVFRIHRDVRFSPDKSPYKTHAACWFYHQDAGKGVGQAAHGGAGFYFHIEPDASIVGAGLWMPSSDALKLVRQAIGSDHAAFRRTLGARAFVRRFGSLSEEAVMRRVPRGFDPDHPAADLLRFRSFTVTRQLAPAEVTSSRLPDLLEREYELLVPMVRWLNSALGFLPADRR